MARSMLKSKRMPQEFWAKAVACAVYLRNRSPTRSIWNMTPQKAWSGHKPNISHLRVFGSIAYMHIPEQKRTKLDDRSEKLIFIGYDSSSKGYKLYNREDRCHQRCDLRGREDMGLEPKGRRDWRRIVDFGIGWVRYASRARWVQGGGAGVVVIDPRGRSGRFPRLYSK